MTSLSERILAHVVQHPGCSVLEMAQALRSHQKSCWAAISAWEDRGLVQRTGAVVNKRRITVWHPTPAALARLADQPLALAEQCRTALERREWRLTDLARVVGQPVPAVRAALEPMIASGDVEVVQTGSVRSYRLRPRDAEPAVRWLHPIRARALGLPVPKSFHTPWWEDAA